MHATAISPVLSPSALFALLGSHAGACTVAALRAAGRTADQVAVPNVCTQTYTALQRTGACRPFLGSLRALLDSHGCDCEDHRQGQPAAAAYGVVYADYCCSLFAGRADVEKSPAHDLITLFGRAVLAERAVLAVTLARPDGDRPRFPEEVAAAVAAAVSDPTQAGRQGFASADDADVLSAAVETLAGHAGWDVWPGPEAFDFAGTFVRLWALSRRGEDAAAEAS